MNIRFQQVTLKHVGKKTCKCGKRFQRTLSVTNTINPFNKDAEGNVKSPTQVYDDVRQQLRRDKTDFNNNAVCTDCEAR